MYNQLQRKGSWILAAVASFLTFDFQFIDIPRTRTYNKKEDRTNLVRTYSELGN